MKRKIVCTIASATGVISSSLIFQACDYLDTLEEVPNRVFEIVPTPEYASITISFLVIPAFFIASS